jgi:signal transduction histidine kinase
MSLTVKLALLLSTIVAFTLFLAWVFTGRTVIQPFTREVMDIYLDETVYVADQIRAGTDPEKLGRMLKLDIRVLDQRPDWVDKLDDPGFGRARCQKETRKDYDIVHCRGPRAPVGIATDAGYIVVRRNLDIGKPGQRIGQLLLGIALVVVLLSAVVAVWITRPLKTTTEAMSRIAQGDLAHRLPVAGGRELSEAARIFNTMADRVDAILRTERELMAGISHELRTPLARMRLETELLRDIETVPEKRLAAMESDLEEIDQLIGELLETSRLSLGDRTLAHEPIDLKVVVEEVIARHPLPNHQVIIEGDSEPVLGDRARLSRVVRNLLENAGKYAPAGTVVKVVLKGSEVEVLDHGPGLAPEDLPRIFEPFYRGQNAKAYAKGLGLGLMIARQVVTLHGGTIEARNREGGGLAIHFRLPPAPRDRA